MYLFIWLPRWVSGKKKSACQAGDGVFNPWVGKKSLEGANGNSLQYSCLENPMGRGAWWAVVHEGHKKLDFFVVQSLNHV